MPAWPPERVTIHEEGFPDAKVPGGRRGRVHVARDPAGLGRDRHRPRRRLGRPGRQDVGRGPVSVDPGANRMRLAVTTYDPFDLSDGIGSFYWQIDSKGAGRPDYVAYM